MEDKILFLGDSFTWGEGLELFIENEKWIKQRELHSEWLQLEVIQDVESIKFREKNRYPRLVGDELNIIPITEFKNGGSFGTNLKFVKDVKIPDLTCIFVQLSQLGRNPLHLTYGCRCSYCTKTHWESIETIYNDILEKKESNGLRYMLDVFGHNEVDNEFLRKFLLFIKWHDRYITELFIEECKKWEQTTPVYFIDSWSIDDSDYWRGYSYINDRLINLTKKDETSTKRWSTFIESFENPYIVDLWPNTVNRHPTLEIQQYLAKSVISHLRENFGY